MSVSLPQDGFTILGELCSHWFVPGATILLIILILIGFYEREAFFDRSLPYPNLSLTQISVTASLWFLTDIYFVEIADPLGNKAFFLGRNALSLAVGILGVGHLEGKNFLVLEKWVGRFKPPAKLIGYSVLMGITGTGLIWGSSFFYPFKFVLNNPSTSTVNLLATISLVVLFIPLTEEIFFRYFLYGFLKNRCGILLAAILVSLVFGLGHGFSPIAPIIAGCSLILIVLVEQTRSIIPALVLHGGFNFLVTSGGILL